MLGRSTPGLPDLARSPIRLLAAAAIGALLTACGGGGVAGSTGSKSGGQRERRRDVFRVGLGLRRCREAWSAVYDRPQQLVHR